MQQRLLGLTDQHLVHLELLELRLLGEIAPQAPHEQALHHVLHDNELQNGTHGSAHSALLLHQKEEHVLYVVLHRARLVQWDRPVPGTVSSEGANSNREAE